MQKVLGMVLVVVGLSSLAFGNVITPEIDGASMVSALTLLGGMTLVVRNRRK